MKKTILLSCAIGFAAMLTSQNYFAVKKVNYSTPGYVFSNISATSGVTNIISGVTNDVLSAEQTIPFAFNYYNTPVTKYKVSDNGYLTFNTTATAAVAPSLTVLPTAGDPNNAIYPFFHDFELKAAPNPNFIVKIFSYTSGTAPNRVHHIHYFGLSRRGEAIVGNSSAYSFVISLFEGAAGTFDITYSSAYGSTAPSGIMGCENVDGTVAKMLGDALGNFKGGVTANPDAVYQFIYGIQPLVDASILSTNVGTVYKNGTSTSISALVTNFGSTAITSANLSYTINGGALQNTPLTGLNIMANGDNVVTVASTIPWVVGAAGVLNDVKVWLSNPNGIADPNKSNDSANSKALSNNGTTTSRKVLFEEATGAWCQHCPDAHVYVDDMRDNFGSNMVIAIHHNGDGMTNSQSDLINAAFATGYPSGFINRTIPTGSATVGISRNAWVSTVASELTKPSPVGVNIKNVVFANGKIDFTVEAEFADYYIGDLRIGAMIKEEFIRGTGSQFDQVIASTYTSNSSHLYFGKTNPMGGYFHKDVIINIPSTAWGTAGSIPNTVMAPGQKVSFNYSYTLPAITRPVIPTTAQFLPKGIQDGRNKPAQMWLIGFVAQYDNNNINNRMIMNANERQMWNKAADIQEQDLAVNTFVLVPNNADAKVDIVLNYSNISAQNAIVNITNALGQIVGTYNFNDLASGLNTLSINTSELANGIYNVNIAGTQLNLNQKLVITH